MAFKMKGPTFFNVGKKGEYKDSAAFQHYVGDDKEHSPSRDDHSDDLQTEEEHKSGKIESKTKTSTETAHGQLNDAEIEGKEDKAYLRSLEKKKKDGTITKAEQSALDRLNVAHD